MRSRSARLTCILVVWIAIGAAGFFLLSSHKQLQALADSRRAVDQHAREAADALADLRVGQQAYVAAGQGVAFWMPKVAATTEAVNAALQALRQSTTTAAGQSAADEAIGAMGEFAAVDKRARDYIRSGQMLMAADVIFTEGGQLATVAARQVATARQAEREAADAAEASARAQSLRAMAGAGAVAALVTLALGLGGRGDRSEEPAAGQDTLGLARAAADEGIVSHARPAAVLATPPSPPPAVPTRNAVVLKAAADLATEFGRARDSAEVERLLSRTAELMDAAGIVVWLGSVDGADLRAVLAHGYSAQTLARMPSVARTADNAAAAAYRSHALQIVLSRPGGSPGAIVAPILTADGCVGALSAEIKGGGEGSEAVQAVASIVAAQLAAVLAVAPVEQAAAEPEAPAAVGAQQRASG
jgi:hypothetical protein